VFELISREGEKLESVADWRNRPVASLTWRDAKAKAAGIADKRADVYGAVRVDYRKIWSVNKLVDEPSR
jgi:hypothetical protein